MVQFLLLYSYSEVLLLLTLTVHFQKPTLKRRKVNLECPPPGFREPNCMHWALKRGLGWIRDRHLMIEVHLSLTNGRLSCLEGFMLSLKMIAGVVASSRDSTNNLQITKIDLHTLTCISIFLNFHMIPPNPYARGYQKCQNHARLNYKNDVLQSSHFVD